MKNSITILVFVVIGFHLSAQPYTTGGKTRHRFAQSTFGFDIRQYSSRGTETWILDEGVPISRELIPTTESRILIGGTHFWGHADFYIGITFLKSGASEFGSSVETGLKVFPWRIEHHKLRPFVGISWQTLGFKQGEGTLQQGSTFPIQAGMSFLHKEHLVELTANYFPQRNLAYYIDPAMNTDIKLPGLSIGLSYKYMIDGTLSAEKNWQSGHTQWLTDTLSTLNRLNGFTLGLGISSGIFLKDAEYNTEVAPYLGQHRFSSVFPELGLGYYFHKPDVQINLAYRRNTSKLEAFQHSQKLIRSAWSLEAFKFLSDYHGFAFFLGGVISYEILKEKEIMPNGEPILTKSDMIRPGVIFGWDIRPNRIQSWYLRTNLRWIPGLKIEKPGNRSVSLDQLEFNFIQLVLFPARMF